MEQKSHTYAVTVVNAREAAGLITPVCATANSEATREHHNLITLAHEQPPNSLTAVTPIRTFEWLGRQRHIVLID